ncbi:MAG: pYEATS domain-containing protein [bacterium]
MNLEIKSEIVPRSKPQRFREGGRLHRNVRIYLQSSREEELDKIESVQYELHPTFRDRFRTSSNRTRNFEIRIWTYGYFKIKAVMRFKDGSSKTVEGFVKW